MNIYMGDTLGVCEIVNEVSGDRDIICPYMSLKCLKPYAFEQGSNISPNPRNTGYG
jgi:hypothetical protein